MKFSVDTNQFKKNLIKLREDLNKTLEDGKLKENFKDQLLEVEEKEKTILRELLPYYRVYALDIYETKINILPVKMEGTYEFNSYLKSYLEVEKDIFIFAGSDLKIYFARILDRQDGKIELSPAIKDFKKLVIAIYQLDKDQTLVFTSSGQIFVFSCKDIKDIFENINNLKINKIDKDFESFENVIKLDENKFICQTAKDQLILLEINREDLRFEIKSEINLSDLVDEIRCLVKISKSKFAMATSNGDFLQAKVQYNQIDIGEKIKILGGPINKLEILENENAERKICAILGNQGKLILYDLESEEIKKSEKELKGDLFNIKTNKGTTIILTADGFMYLFEENFGEWKVNSKISQDDIFLMNLIVLDPSNYLALDLDGNFYILEIDRLNSIEKLYDLDLYK